MARPYSDRVKLWVSENMAATLDDRAFNSLVELAMNDAGNKRIQNWLLEMKLVGKVRVGVIGVMVDDGKQLNACAKVIVPGKVTFMHEELYTNFPSDHFKTKVLLVTGGA